MTLVVSVMPLNVSTMSRMTAGETYEEFVKKFEPKRTTDDCYTPPAVYEAIKEWVLETYPDARDREIIRPFYPGGDYENADYPPGCIVLDNPPFSIMAHIRRFYMSRGVTYFLFAPTKTIFQGNIGDNVVFNAGKVTYENGAEVPTSFATNLPGPRVTVSKELGDRINSAQERPASPPKFSYPDQVFTFSDFQSAARYGIDVNLTDSQVAYVTTLDEQKAAGKKIYGAGLFVADEIARDLKARIRAAREQARSTPTASSEGVHVWELSERERGIVAGLG